MPRGIRNWQYKDIKQFLKEHDFVMDYQTSSSHEFWRNGDKVVNVNYISSGSYPPLTMKTMIRQSGIEESEWRSWAGR